MSASAFPLHTAIVMDGNGRWATARGRPRIFGHRAGASAVRRTVEAARHLGLPVLTLFAFSSDNWERPRTEVSALFVLFREFLEAETARCRDEGIRLEIIGRRDRLPARVLQAVERAEAMTAASSAMRLRVAVDYSAREAIAAAAHRLSPTSRAPRDDLARLIGGPDVDLLIRTGGEQRLSDFLLWEAAYAELVFLDVPWPEFGRDHLEGALHEFARRQRRFGRIAAAV
ncbi:MAG TPA: polyprenyl diphosphate synthase [Candidatus Polarisedimenticolaceae bacterium]|nr:polyprenyl diphosphate synthase [Candidatus Polarisedimenticolaceae bacterium]